ncbi:3'-5' exonuclease family protein [Sansalvadorimonas verongulae]|uniref:3'-5' exoribonuclease n=1 Tax=Sansalvadorimonas verongulae TaxID=2172824 RepID=UPI0012BB6F33|nr:3'-5' exoribonuclease [Sansalvadorimonas verongulae]MTI12306.1 hypothetical protein [Sansalvadorimonas verongulae]
MKLFIDCEWNGHKGQLISMALVPEDGDAFYEVLECATPIDWVRDNVIPVLGKDPVSQEQFTERLQDFLGQFDEDSVEVIADWPDDIKYFCDALVARDRCNIGPGSFAMTVDRTLFNAKSKVPHNALEDARAIRQYYLCPGDDLNNLLNNPHQHF